MLRCKQVSNALAKEHYSQLPWHKKVGLRMHVGLCIFCGKYHKQVLWFQNGVEKYLQNEEEPAKHSSLRMDPDTKSRMKQALEAAAGSDSD